jgi:hypothetical protein
MSTSLATLILFRCHAQNFFTSYPDNYTTIQNNRIRIRFVSKGQLARFDFPTFALSMLSFVVLFSAVTSALDFYANYFLCDPVLTRSFATARERQVCRKNAFLDIFFSLGRHFLPLPAGPSCNSCADGECGFVWFSDVPRFLCLPLSMLRSKQLHAFPVFPFFPGVFE